MVFANMKNGNDLTHRMSMMSAATGSQRIPNRANGSIRHWLPHSRATEYATAAASGGRKAQALHMNLAFVYLYFVPSMCAG